MKDDEGISQIWTVSPATGELKQLTRNKSEVTSAMSWSANGKWIAHGMAGQVCLTDTSTGITHPIVSRQSENATTVKHEAGDMRKEACVISPDGRKIAFVRSKSDSSGSTNQICVIELEQSLN
jgi:Tol biopolymer transport system component